MSFFRTVWPLVWKDVMSEIRSREVLTSMCFFAFLVLTIFNFAFSTGMEGSSTGVLSGMLWVAFIFSGLLGLNQTFASEKDGGSWQGLLLCPVSRATIYLGKMVGNLLFMTIMEVFLLVLFAVLFRADVLPHLTTLSLVIFLGTLGFVSVGTILSAMAITAKAREILLAVILFPILVPLIIAAVKGTEGLLMGKTLVDISGWLKILVAFDLSFLLLPIWCFEFVVEE